VIKKTYLLGLVLLVFLLGIQQEWPQGLVLSNSTQKTGSAPFADIPLFEEDSEEEDDFAADELLDPFTPTVVLLFPYLPHFSPQPRSQSGLYILKHSYLI